MRYFRGGDPLEDFDRYDREKERRLARLPVCDNCNRRIQDDDYYDLEGEILCESCLKDKYRRSVEDYCFSN